MTRRLLLLALIVVGLVATATPAHAHGNPTVLRLPPISVAGAPRTLVTMAVAVPSELRDAGRVAFVVEQTGPIEIVGRLEGVLDGVSPIGPTRSVMLTLRVPADALVGLLDVADVSFSAPDGRTVVVPIILRVPAVRALFVSGTREMRALREGDRVELAYRVHNLGNTPEVLEVTIATPNAWVSRTPRVSRVTIAAHSHREIDVFVAVPPGVTEGDHFVSVRAQRAESDSAIAATATTVLRTLEADGRLPGLMLEPLLASSSTADGTVVRSIFRLSGPIGSSMRLVATAMPVRAPGGLHVVGLSAVGAMAAPLQATLSGRTWTVDGGNVSMQISNLAGVNVTGTGLVGRARSGRFDINALAAGPLAGSNTGAAYYGGSVATDVSFGRLGVAVSHLRTEGLGGNGQALDAVGADWTSNAIGTLRVGAGLALRQSNNGSGLGAEAQVVHERDGESARLRVRHSPGGSQAFAMSTDYLDFEARKRFGERWATNASISKSRDENSTFAEISALSMSVGQNFQASQNIALFVRGNSSRTEVRSASPLLGAFGSRDEGVSFGSQLTFGETQVSTEMRASVLTRESSLLSGGTSSYSAGQYVSQLSAARSFRKFGTVDAGVGLTRTGGGIGAPGSVKSANARWSRVPLMVGPQVVLFGVGAQYLSVADGRSYLISRASATTSIARGFEVAASFERNPFFRAASGGSGSVFALRVSTTAEVMSASRFAEPGTVYEDRNANGRRDEGERGIGGVTLRQGNLRMVTNREGTYRVPAGVRGRLRIDPGSIPRGMVTHPRYAVDSIEARDVPLVPTGTATVSISIVADSAGRRPQVDLALAQVWLRDANGLDWVGVSEGDGTFRFAQIPIGPYSIRADFRRLQEPLRVDENLTIEVLPGSQSVRLIEARGRAIRMTVPTPRNGNGRGSGRGGRA